MKYSPKFESDYTWFQSISALFCFDGVNEYYNKIGKPIIVPSSQGVTAKEAFYLYDSQGIIKPTSEPDKLRTLLKTKGSVNLHIKMYAEDLAQGYLLMADFRELINEIKAPMWFESAVINQMQKIVKERREKEAKALLANMNNDKNGYLQFINAMQNYVAKSKKDV